MTTQQTSHTKVNFDKFEPANVLNIFADISKIPRGSGHEKAVSDYVAAFARERGAEVVQDAWNNLIIFKPASPGFSDKPLILQAHLDMVCEKNADIKHDFTRNPLDLYIDGDFIKARGTTLGADNGVGVAMCLALLELNTEHPPLEIVLTTHEETGMDGAENLDTSLLKGKRMLNLDSSDETTFTMGCAAGTTAEFMIPAEWESCENSAVCEISVKGLKGGHSGGDIHKERGNALRILAFLLNALGSDICLTEILGGMKVNAIPREASASIVFSNTDAAKINAALEACFENFSKQYRATDPGLQIDWAFSEKSEMKFLTRDCTKKVISSLLLIPTGAMSRSLEIEGLVNASCNIGVAESTEQHVKISAMPRGVASYYTHQLEVQISALADLMGAEVIFLQRSPEWQYNPDSALLKTSLDIYKTVFKRETAATAVHGGLECGIFSAKIPGIDIISFGPNAYDYHTPDEKLSISSTKRVWEFLVELLRSLK